MLTLDQTVLVLVDVQGKLAQVMYERDRLFGALEKLVKGAQALGIPIIWLEQNPGRMGPTISELQALLSAGKPIAKMSFSCCGDPAFNAKLESLGRKQALVAGIEAHVCIYQTVRDLLARGYEVEVVSDAVSSRTASNLQVALDKFRACGAGVTSVEMAFFELLRTADHPAFKQILSIVK